MKIIGITMGDPASIGPEITAKALSDPAVYERCKPLVVGDAAVMEEALKITGLSGKLKIHKIGGCQRSAVPIRHHRRLRHGDGGHEGAEAGRSLRHGWKRSLPVCEEGH